MANNKKEVFVLGLTLGIFGGLAGAGVLFLAKNKTPIAIDTSNPTASNTNFDLASRKSEGEKILITSEINPDKEQAIAAITKKDYATAITKWEASISKIAGGLRKNATRQGIQQTLASNNFEVEGAAGKITFQPSGDRANASILVKVSKGDRSGVGYDFVPLR